MGKDVRRTQVEKAILAMSKYDTTQLYQLIDTNRCFVIYGKDGFLSKVAYASKRLKICGVNIDDSILKIEKEQPYHTKYTVPFCSSKGTDKSMGFALIFSFAEYRKDDMIDFMDVALNLNPGATTVPVPNRQ